MITIMCIITGDQNRILDWIIYVVPTGGQLYSFYFYSMQRDKFLFVSELFSKEVGRVQGFNIHIGL